MTKLKRARRTPCPKGSGQEELPHVQGQGQRPRLPDCDGAETAERNYPASEVGGGRLRGDTQRPRSGVATRGVTCVRGQGWRREELPRVGGQEPWLGGATPRP